MTVPWNDIIFGVISFTSGLWTGLTVCRIKAARRERHYVALGTLKSLKGSEDTPFVGIPQPRSPEGE